MGKPYYGQRNGKSWIYRQKLKLKKSNTGNNTDNAEENGQNSRIIVRNLPFKVTEEDIKKFYKPFGDITEVNLLKRPDGSLVGCGFIRFKCIEDASKAIFNTNKKEFLGRIISCDWAISKSKFREKLEKNLSGNHETDKKDEKQPCQNDDAQKEDNEDNNIHKKKFTKEKDNLKKQQKRKFQKMKKQKKRARIVIRNLSFQITEDNLKEFFSQYGEINEIKILSKPDGKQIGVAFVQFNVVQSAAKAIHYANMQSLLNRPMIVDWAVPKNKFSENTDVKSEIKTVSIDENELHDTSEIKVIGSEDEDSESDAESNSKEVSIKSIQEETESEKEEAEIKHEDTDNKDDNDNDSNDDDDINITIDQSIVKLEEKNEKKKNCSDAKHPQRSNDVSEGRTVFLKNVPFAVKNDELKSFIEQFGPIYYALVCIDPLTEYSKGTAFVKFRHIEDAEKCLMAGTELRLRDQIIETHRALHKQEVANKTNLKKQKTKDSRNLYLVKEGVVLVGSSAALEVSMSDMEKRLKLERWKSQMLRNLNMFISRTRLAIHNLPSNLDDAELRQLFKNHSGPKAVITEARVMRDLRNVDATGKNKSKEYGFVTFTSHEDALKALRSINNNPNIFSKHRRPIVGFSIENRILVNAKERRIQKSRDRNPLWSGNKNKRKSEDAEEEIRDTKRVKNRRVIENELNKKSYTGITGNLGEDKLRSNFTLKSQAKVHMQTVKKQKKLTKTIKQSETAKKAKIKKMQDNMPTKQVKKFDIDTNDTNFNMLLNNYRNKLKGIDLKKSKWYESSNGS